MMHLVRVSLWPYWLHMGEMEKMFQGTVCIKISTINFCYLSQTNWWKCCNLPKYSVLISFLFDSRSIVKKLGPERRSKIKIVGKDEVEGSFYGQLVLGKGVTSSLDEQLIREAQKAGGYCWMKKLLSRSFLFQFKDHLKLIPKVLLQQLPQRSRGLQKRLHRS